MINIIEPIECSPQPVGNFNWVVFAVLLHIMIVIFRNNLSDISKSLLIVIILLKLYPVIEIGSPPLNEFVDFFLEVSYI